MEKEDVRRIPPQEARRKLEDGEAILVCGYESDEKYQSNQLEGSVSWNDFQARLPDIPKGQEIIFYCA